MPASLNQRLRQLIVLGLCLAFGAALSVGFGQDALWDTKNYHLYNAWAFLHHRYAQDIAPAGMQSYFNPLADLPYFALAQGPLHAWPRTLAAVQGLWFGALAYLIVGIARQSARLQERPFGWADICAALIGATGTMAVSQVGSTTNEISLAVLVLLGVHVLMRALPLRDNAIGLKPVLLAGFCCGLAAGFKPTAMVYPPALALALLVTLDIRTRRAWQATAIFTAGAAAAFLVAYGPWGLHLYRETGNPTFPLFNQLFHSSLTAASDGTDGRFRPQTLTQWLFYPFFWIKKQRDIVTEAAFADPRYALAMLALLAIGAARWFRRSPGTQPQDRGRCLLAIFISVSYVLWLATFSILRYAISIEALTGTLMLSAAWSWRSTGSRRISLHPAAWSLLLLAILATTTYPNWWRSTYAQHVFQVETGTVEPNSLVILAGTPDAYLAPMFPQNETVAFVGLNWFVRASQGHGLWNLVQQRLREHRGPHYVVLRDDPANAQEKDLLSEMLPDYRITDCRDIPSNLEVGRKGNSYAQGLRLCRLAQG
jgi:hypothetical protein